MVSPPFTLQTTGCLRFIFENYYSYIRFRLSTSRSDSYTVIYSANTYDYYSSEIQFEIAPGDYSGIVFEMQEFDPFTYIYGGIDNITLHDTQCSSK